MANSAKAKGDSAEREIASILLDHLGLPVRRQLGAGRQDDVGDLDGIPNTVLQVASWADVARAAREKPLAAEQQRLNANATFAATLIRFRNGRGMDPHDRWRAVMTIEQFCTYVRETL